MTNPMARWGDRGKHEGHDEDSKITEEPRLITINPKRKKTSVTSKNSQ